MNPQDFREHKPHNCRRAAFHDYNAPGSYMISISKDPSCLSFSRLSGDPRDPDNPPSVILTEVGDIIRHQIQCIEDWHYFKIPTFVIMPDHVHIIWQVNQYMDHELGHFIGKFKSRCSLNLNKLLQSKGAATSKQSVFNIKFNDRIAFDEEMLSRFKNYVIDNPRRRLITIKYPHLFQRIQCVEIGNLEMDLYGNFQLLRHPLIAPAIVSSRYIKEEKEYWQRVWEEAIRTQGVLISPFISDAEKSIMHRAISEGASIIKIIPDGLPPKFKPSGKDFELCLEGRCLFIGPPRLSKRNHAITRQECMTYNELARWISGHPQEMMRLIDISRNR